MTYQDYQPKETRAHNSTDLPLINAMAEFLKANSPEQLLRSVASAAIEAQRNVDHERACGLGWLAAKCNGVADGSRA